MWKLLNLSYGLLACNETSSLVENVKPVKFIWWCIRLLGNIWFGEDYETCQIYLMIDPPDFKHLVQLRIWNLWNFSDDLSVCYERFSLAKYWKVIKFILWFIRMLWNIYFGWRMQQLLNLIYDLSACYETSSLVKNIKSLKFSFSFFHLIWNIYFSGEYENCQIYLKNYAPPMKHLV